jgi:pimeloyl-ACP methyl ester carboxylesterase
MTIDRVKSADGTAIAFETVGAGPALILVGGALCDRSARVAGRPLASLLAARLSVVSYDRRGRGDSGDTPPWTIDREVQDLAALISAAGGTAFVYGHSSGALLALEAAVQLPSIAKLALYEAPLVLDPHRAMSLGPLAQRAAEAVAGDRRSEAVELFLDRGMQLPAPTMAQMRQSPVWPGLEKLAHTLSYDLRLAARGPALMDRAASVRTPTLVMHGDASPDWMREAMKALAKVISGARSRTLPGTHDVDLVALVPALEEFFTQ